MYFFVNNSSVKIGTYILWYISDTYNVINYCVFPFANTFVDFQLSADSFWKFVFFTLNHL